MHILIGGFQHETNTFAPSRADWPAFNRGDGFPAYARGAEMLARMEPLNFGIGGFMAVAREIGWQVVPSVWAGATPSAHVTDDAFERIASELLEDARQALARGQLDAVFLDLHGAAVTERFEDAEGELLARLRALIGPDRPIVTTLDLHANVSPRMLELADAMVAYRTYPHTDMAATGRLAAQALQRRIARGTREPMHARRIPFLLSLNVQSTMTEPAASVYRQLLELDGARGTLLSFAMGFPAADIEHCGPVVWGYGDQAEAAVQALHAYAVAVRSQWRLDLLPPAEAVARALALAEGARRPVVIADTQDNPGAGGNSNTTGLLHALLAAGAGRLHPRQVALGLMYDPDAARAAHAAGVGARLYLSVGRTEPTWGGGFSDAPVQGEFTVLALSDGRVVGAGPVLGGTPVHLGASACLAIDGVRVVVVSGKCQMMDRELFRFAGVEPESMKILVVKSSVHFRADFTPIAEDILVARAPGPVAADPADFPWRRLPASIDRRP